VFIPIQVASFITALVIAWSIIFFCWYNVRHSYCSSSVYKSFVSMD